MSSKNIKQLVTAALLLALALVFQSGIRFLLGDHIASTYLISTLVNLCLILAACFVNLWAGLLIAVAAPLMAFLQGHVKLPLMLPFLMVGNAVPVLLYGLFSGKTLRKTGKMKLASWSATGVAAAVLKFAVIALGNALVLSTKQGTVLWAAIGAGAGLQIQQLITAILAMLICYAILPRIKKAVD
jgi:hypothetical protein